MDLSAVAFLVIVFATLLMGIWVGLALLVSAAAATACVDATGPRSETKPCESQGSGTRC